MAHSRLEGRIIRKAVVVNGLFFLSRNVPLAWESARPTDHTLSSNFFTMQTARCGTSKTFSIAVNVHPERPEVSRSSGWHKIVSFKQT